MVYGLAFVAELGWLKDIEMIFFGSLEEQCDGLAPRYLVEQEHITPDFVVIGEPTELDLYLGQRGRIELRVTLQGKAAHAATPELGNNPLYTMARVLQNIQALNDTFNHSESSLKTSSIAATDIRCKTASINAVPSECSIILDRRLALGETVDQAKSEIQACLSHIPARDVKLETLHYDEPSYTGLVFPVEKYFPAWYINPDHPYVSHARQAYKLAYGVEATLGAWPASTNGTYWNGVAGIPSIGFGPGSLEFAHRINEHVDLDDVLRSVIFYAMFPAILQEAG
jgi:putative selenium metabolism hydrolase